MRQDAFPSLHGFFVVVVVSVAVLVMVVLKKGSRIHPTYNSFLRALLFAFEICKFHDLSTLLKLSSGGRGLLIDWILDAVQQKLPL